MNVIPEVAKAKDVTDRRTARLHSDLLDAAAELLAEQNPLDKVSLGAVAGRAGVSPTAVYRHFDAPLAVMRRAIHRPARALQRSRDDGAGQVPGDVLERPPCRGTEGRCGDLLVVSTQVHTWIHGILHELPRAPPTRETH